MLRRSAYNYDPLASPPIVRIAWEGAGISATAGMIIAHKPASVKQGVLLFTIEGTTLARL